MGICTQPVTKIIQHSHRNRLYHRALHKFTNAIFIQAQPPYKLYIKFKIHWWGFVQDVFCYNIVIYRIGGNLRDENFAKRLKTGFSHLNFHESSRLTGLKYSKTAYSRLYFRERKFSRKICKNLVPRIFLPIR